MTREEKSKRIYFIQMSQDFFDEIPVKRLLMTSAGDTMLRIYLQLWCKSLRDGGTLTLTGDMPLAEELAMILDVRPVTAEQWTAELRMIETAVRCCTDFGLISVDGDIVDFVQTEQYTRKYTKETVENWNKNSDEKPEKKQSNKAKAQAEADAMFERLWRQYFIGYKEDKGRVKPATKYRLYKEYGEERCQKALDEYKVSKKVKDGFILQAKNFFNDRIFSYLDGDAGQDAAYTTTPTKEVITEQAAQAEIDQQGLYAYDGGYDMALWAQIKGRYSPEMRAAIEKVMQA